MKTYLISLLKVVLVFFAPIAPLIFLVALSTIFDTGFGIWKAKSLGIEINSKIITHEVAHYWYDRLCLYEKGWKQKSEDFVIKFEDYKEK